MRPIGWKILVVVLLTVGASLAAIDRVFEIQGVGFADQLVIIETPREMKSVSYDCWTVDDETRRRAEETADPNLFLWQEAVLDRHQFIARVMFTDNTGLFHHHRHHLAHIIVMAYLADGTRACRVALLPKDVGSTPVVIGFE
jgi:hypothetical protein